MKKLLVSICISFILFSCSSTIDSKINVTEYQVKIEQIKKQNANYSEKDFSTANKELDKYTFSAMSSGNYVLDITYKDLLEKAKEINLKNQLEIDNFNKEVQKIRDMFSVLVLKGVYVDNTNQLPDFPNGYLMDLKVLNKSSKVITGFKGKILLFNENEDQILSYIIEETAQIKSDFEMEAQTNAVIFEEDNLMELKALPFGKIKQRWYPELVIFSDGTRMQSPPKPYTLNL